MKDRIVSGTNSKLGQVKPCNPAKSTKAARIYNTASTLLLVKQLDMFESSKKVSNAVYTTCILLCYVS